MELLLSISSPIPETRELLFGRADPPHGFTVNVDNIGATLSYDGFKARRAFELSDVITLVLGFTTGIGSGIVANWIYETLKSTRAKGVVLNGEAVAVDLEAIKKKLDELISKQPRDDDTVK